MKIDIIQEQTFTLRAGRNALQGLRAVAEWEGLTKYEDSRGKSLILDGRTLVKGSTDLLQVLQLGAVPSGFVPVPETTLPGGHVVPAFLVAQYSSSKSADSTVVIDADLSPWVRINFHDSKAAAEAAGYSMITETQWLAIAYNASQQAVNWTGGEIGAGKMWQGIRKGNVSGAQRGSYMPADSDEYRWLELSNGSRICDFNGNVFQWVFDDVQGDDDGLINAEIGLGSISQSTAPYPADTHGMGWRPSSSRDWSGHALIRGGYWYSDDNAGAFYLNRDWPGGVLDDVGFRCTLPSSGL